MSEKSHKDAITSAAITSDADQHGHETAENDKAEPSVKELREMAINDIPKVSGEISVEASTKDCVCICACADEEPTEEKIFNNIQKSKIDKREYRGMVLKNGLRVMLISDVDTNRSAVCLDVNVGSWSDPRLMDHRPQRSHCRSSFLGSIRVLLHTCNPQKRADRQTSPRLLSQLLLLH